MTIKFTSFHSIDFLFIVCFLFVLTVKTKQTNVNLNHLLIDSQFVLFLITSLHEFHVFLLLFFFLLIFIFQVYTRPLITLIKKKELNEFVVVYLGFKVSL